MTQRVSEAVESAPMKRYLADIVALAVVLGLGVLFYFPESDPLESRYVFYADAFERTACDINPEYDNFYRRFPWERFSCLMTLAARYVLLAFRDDPGMAVLVLYFGLALAAGVLTYVVNRWYFSALPALFISVLLLYDRAVMPAARGLGMMWMPLLAPLLLVFIHSLARTQDRELRWRRRLVPIALVVVSGALIHSLGGHDSIYAIVFGLAFLAVIVLAWIIRTIRLRALTPGPTFATLLGVSGAVLLACLLYYAVWRGTATIQSPCRWTDTVRHASLVYVGTYNIKHELGMEDTSRLEQWKATFYLGKYPSQYGRRHENVFLYPGPGFNGMIPLFVYPGFLVGMFLFGRKVLRSVWPRRAEIVDRKQQYFFVYNFVLLGAFVGVMLVSCDPKPTRYAPCIYAVYAVSTIGYQWIYHAAKAFLAKRSWPAVTRRRLVLARAGAASLLVAIGVFAAQRLHKNYGDLGLYCDRYQLEIPTIGLPPVLERARAEYASRPVYIVNTTTTDYHPAVGLLVGYRELPNTTIVKRLRGLELPADAVVFARDRKNSTWRCTDAAESGK